MLHTRFFKSFLVAFLVFLLSFSSLFFSWQARASEEARLGFNLGGVLLRWNLISSGFLAPEAMVAGKTVGDSLRSLRESLTATKVSVDYQRRVEVLESKLEAAKEHNLWSIQLGYWSFGDEDPSVTLHGAETSALRGEARTRSFHYLSFPGGEAIAEIDLEEKITSLPLDEFTIELWIRPENITDGTILESNDWKLAVLSEEIALFEGENILFQTGQLQKNRWTHLAITVDREEVKVFQNGSFLEKAQKPQRLSLRGDMILGGGFTGRMDELRIRQERVESFRLRFDQPIDYLLGFPVIEQANETFPEESLWDFYAGLMLSSLSVKRGSDMFALETDDLAGVAEVLLGEVEGLPGPPERVPDRVLDLLVGMQGLSREERLSEQDRSEVEQTLEALINHFGLR